MPDWTDWTPQWKTTDDATPSTVTYAYPDGSFSVTVDVQGMIRVQRDDWLSKYTLAIHGTTDVTKLFVRILPGDRVLPITNVDLILEGETLLHIPSYIHFNNWYQLTHREQQIPVDGVEPPPVTIDPTDTDWNYAVGRAGNAVDVIAGVATIAEVSTEALGATAAAGTAAAVGTALTLVSVPLFIISAVWDLAQAWEVGVKVEMLYASAYAATAWVFDDLYQLAPLSRPAALSPDSPSLRFPVPEEAADADRWRQEYGNWSNTDHYVNLFSTSWTETADVIIEKFEERLEDMRHVGPAPWGSYRGPGFSAAAFRSELRTVLVPMENDSAPHAAKPYMLNRREYFNLFLKLLHDSSFGWANNIERKLFERARETFKPPLRNPESSIP